MERWTRLSDASWQKFESIFEANLKTPPLACTVPRTPNAPKKPCKQTRRGERLQPRRLVFDSEHQARPRTRRQDRPRARGEPIRVWEDSGVALWSSSVTSTQRSNERRLRSTPRPESDDIIPNSQVDRNEPGSLRHRLNQWISRHSFPRGLDHLID